MRILLVEDDTELGNGVKVGFEQQGFVVDWLTNLSALTIYLAHTHYAALILDLSLPDGDGRAWLERARANGVALPILIITARDAVPDRIDGLNAGADDYLAKPFDLSECIARVHALIRRSAGHSNNFLKHGRLAFDLTQHRVTFDGIDCGLTRREVDLLHVFLLHPKRVFSRDDLEAHLYDDESAIESNTIEVHLYKLRKKIHPKIIQNLRGIGYVLAPPL